MSGLGTSTRLRRGWALLAIAVTLVLVVWGAVAGSQVPDGFLEADPDKTDVALYQAISERMGDGESYYVAVAAEQPARGFPTSPAVTVREPTLAWLTSTAGEGTAYGILLALAAVAIGLSIVCFDSLTRTRAEWAVASVVGAVGVAALCSPDGVWIHETWAGLLTYVAALAATRHWFWPALIALLAACVVRELALPAGLAVLAAAWPRLSVRRRLASVVAVAGFLAFYGWHVLQVGRMSAGASEPSSGWLDVNGWPFFVNAAWFSTVLTVAPVLVAVLLVPLALLGWVLHDSVDARPVAAVLVAYALVFAVVGRDNNLYWGILFGPLLLPGLAFAPRAVARLTRAAHPRGAV
ncbi:hypothetical protein [Aeromicrobium fastidiosum]|uniref:DUF2029 domain-containing protein n=1 Tax=Aeromicrobium fastidiosum TaxID=52699 RepID=A0A641ARH7_9ACTN|nr:hypothetical protein [Aeromicrobium fastidiosum]KAA1379671.1 hypothetical protein ESP62_000120 [Aeromicrobium fastidiosum]MBP2389147.1 putative nucleic acid-binding protein [Aeromicrobium fastidiosum]